ncbi:imidazolonepropionase-like domain-containing protein [Paraflavitalea speifideaquila]|uniref:imidazolonepropionase-like domain-containing protein n=1 Tax=Paraflavitalea speifideaquila TaxID=3076558 RepID=UPI0028E525E4|nr:hypothetical protein [Paraflavitalea speifideiaquila]
MRKTNWIAALTMLFACQNKEQADLIIYNAVVYTVDSAFSTAEALAVKDGKILATGKTADLLAQYEAKEKKDADGQFVYPGLIDAHCHFFRYGVGLREANLVGTISWEEILKSYRLLQRKIRQDGSQDAAGIRMTGR